jgi:integrase
VVFYRGRGDDGKKKYDWHRGGATREEADKERVRLLRELHLGSYVEPNKLTVADFLEQWLGHVAASIRPKTLEFYTEAVQKYLVPALGKHKLTGLQPVHIQNYYDRALTSGRIHGPGGLAPKTVHHHHCVLHQALELAVRWNLIARNPVALTDPPRPEKHDMRFLTEDETTHLLTTARDHRFFLPILIAVSTGMRRGEVLGLRWSDTDLNVGAFTINQTLEAVVAGKPLFRPPKTQKSRRTITISSSVKEHLRAHKQAQGDTLYHTDASLGHLDLVCSASDGQALEPGNVSHKFSKIAESAGFGDLNFHGLRHTHVAHLIKAGVHAKVISERLGHSNIGTTMNIYGHLFPQFDQEAAQQVDRLFSRIIG